MNENSYRNCKIEKVTASKIFTWDSKGNWDQIIVCGNDPRDIILRYDSFSLFISSFF